MSQVEVFELHFYQRDGCHLCEAMEKALVDYLRERRGQTGIDGLDPDRLKIVRRDIEDRESWLERYREYIPVLEFRGEELCHYFFDSGEMDRALGLHPVTGRGRITPSHEDDAS